MLLCHLWWAASSRSISIAVNSHSSALDRKSSSYRRIRISNVIFLNPPQIAAPHFLQPKLCLKLSVTRFDTNSEIKPNETIDNHSGYRKLVSTLD